METVTSELSDKQLEDVLSKWQLAWKQALLASVGDECADTLLITGLLKL